MNRRARRFPAGGRGVVGARSNIAVPAGWGSARSRIAVPTWTRAENLRAYIATPMWAGAGSARS